MVHFPSRSVEDISEQAAHECGDKKKKKKTLCRCQRSFQLTEFQELSVNQSHICWESWLSLATLKIPQQEGGDVASHCPCLLQTRVLHK